MLHSGSRRIGNHTAQTYDKIARKQTEQRGEGDQVVCRACGCTATALSCDQCPCDPSIPRHDVVSTGCWWRVRKGKPTYTT